MVWSKAEEAGYLLRPIFPSRTYYSIFRSSGRAVEDDREVICSDVEVVLSACHIANPVPSGLWLSPRLQTCLLSLHMQKRCFGSQPFLWNNSECTPSWALQAARPCVKGGVDADALISPLLSIASCTTEQHGDSMERQVFCVCRNVLSFPAVFTVADGDSLTAT